MGPTIDEGYEPGRAKLLAVVHKPHGRKTLFAGLVLLVVLAGVALPVSKWPFSQKNVVSDLEQGTQSKVTVTSFHPIYYPHPGCVMEGLTFHREGVGLPPMTVKRLTIQGSYVGLMSRSIPLLLAEGVHLTLPQLSGQNKSLVRPPTSSQATIGKAMVKDAVLDFERAAPQPPLSFELHEFTLENPGLGHTMKFEAKLHNPEPTGEVVSQGELGPWKDTDPMATEVRGSYSFTNGNLGAFGGIGGNLSSEGRYQGPLRQISAQGSASVMEFEVNGNAQHKAALKTQYRAQVNGQNGDVQLEQVSTAVGPGASELIATGSVSGGPGKQGKLASFDLAVPRGRLQDFLELFVHSQRSPMTGAFSFKGHANVEPGRRSFYDALLLEGDFGIGGGRFTNQQTQGNIEQLSKQAEGQPKEEPESVVSDVKGHCVLKDGVATFSNLSFRVPGAKAKMHGTFDLRTKDINLRGTVYGDATLAQSTTGFKSFLMKALSPFIKKNHHGGSIIPVTITGTYQHPVYKTDPI